MEIVIQLAVGVVMGAICAVAAQNRGRSAVGWFFVGFLTGCIGVILVFVLPDQKVQQERERRLADENRRLREQVRKDRMVADRRHGDLQRRLAAHDAAIGIDTAGSEAQALPSSAAPMAGASGAADVRSVPWHYVDSGQRRGPVPFPQLRLLWGTGKVAGTTLVWTGGMANWQAIDDLDDLRVALDA